MTIEYSWEQRDLLRNNQAIPLTLEKDNVIYHCPNCLDLGTVMVWKITGGPYASPSGKGAKWIDVKSGGLPRG